MDGILHSLVCLVCLVLVNVVEIVRIKQEDRCLNHHWGETIGHGQKCVSLFRDGIESLIPR